MQSRQRTLAHTHRVQVAHGNEEDIKILTGHVKRLQDTIITPLNSAVANDESYMTGTLRDLLDKLAK